MAEFTIKSTMELLRARQLQAGGAAQVFVDSEVLRRCAPKVPLRDGYLIRSGVTNTKTGSGEVKYSTPYARRMYYHSEYSFTGAPERGAYWFERMKQDGGKEAILRGVAELTGGEAK